mgnify:CR=1 FL=1
MQRVLIRNGRCLYRFLHQAAIFILHQLLYFHSPSIIVIILRAAEKMFSSVSRNNADLPNETHRNSERRSLYWIVKVQILHKI